jgi:hypothetical protein
MQTFVDAPLTGESTTTTARYLVVALMTCPATRISCSCHRATAGA